MIRALVSTAALVVALVLAAAAPRVALATPSKDACNQMLAWNPQYPSITVVAPGTHCLDHDIVLGDGDNVDNVIRLDYLGDMTIDCRGHLIEYTGSAEVTAIIDTSEYGTITIRNCRFRGFAQSIDLGPDYVIEDNVVHSSRARANGGSVAIRGQGTGTVRRNRVFDSVGVAIEAGGDSFVVDNLVDGVSDGVLDSVITGILLTGEGAPLVQRNTVRGLRHEDETQFDTTEGIRLAGADVPGHRAEVSDNVIVHVPNLGFSAGVYCSSETSRAADNVVSGFAEALVTCADAGDNDASP